MILLGEIDPVIRVKAIMALLGIALAGLGLIVLIVTGARMVRRIGREGRTKSSRHEEWIAGEPLRPGDLPPPKEKPRVEDEEE